jgi:predicted permease
MSTFFNDIKYGFRQLHKSPSFTATAVLMLAIGIGTNVTIFSLINGWMFRPLPGKREGKLVRLYSGSKESDGHYRNFSYPYFRELRTQNTSFHSLSAFSPTSFGIREGDITRIAIGAYISSNFFDTFGVTPIQGRVFTVEEEQPGSQVPVAIVSYRLWKRLGSDPSMVGRTIIVNNNPLTVVGILPESFISASQITNKEIWLPLGMIGGFSNLAQKEETPRLYNHSYRGLFLIGQLKPGLTKTALQSRLNHLAESLAQIYPEKYKEHTLTSGPIGHIIMSSAPGDDLPVKTPIIALIAISGVILLIVCMNMANLLLAHSWRRRQEITIRLALGSNRAQIIRQFLIEGLLLSLPAGVISIVFARWGARILVISLEKWTGGEGTIPIELDWRLLGTVVGLCVLSVLLFGLGPAWHISGMRPLVIKDLMGSTAGGKAWWRKSLVAAQISLAFILVTCSVLLVRSAWGASRADPGFALDRGLLIELSLGYNSTSKEQKCRTYRAVMERLRSTAGIKAVSLGSTVPFGDAYMSNVYQRVSSVSLVTPTPTKTVLPTRARCNIIGSDYFKALGVNILRGREFTPVEEQSDQGPRVTIIDDLLVQRLWPNENPIGQYLQEGNNQENILQIVGVVPHLRDNIIEHQANAHVYLPFGQHFNPHMFIHVQLYDSYSLATLSSMKQVIQKELKAVDPDLSILGIRTWQEYIHSFSFQAWTIEMSAGLFAIFGSLALGLAAAGLFSIKAYWVSQRTREMGIRMALGARPCEVARPVICNALLTAGFGLIVGIPFALALTRLLQNTLFGISPHDQVTIVFSIFLVLIVSALAAWIPARRAAKVDPMEALRYE